MFGGVPIATRARGTWPCPGGERVLQCEPFSCSADLPSIDALQLGSAQHAQHLKCGHRFILYQTRRPLFPISHQWSCCPYVIYGSAQSLRFSSSGFWVLLKASSSDLLNSDLRHLCGSRLSHHRPKLPFGTAIYSLSFDSGGGLSGFF